MEEIKKYIKSPEYIIIFIATLVVALYFSINGSTASDAILMINENKYFLYIILLGVFSLYILRSTKELKIRSVLKTWLANTKTIIVIAAFTIISLAVLVVLIGEITTIIGMADIEARSLEPVIKQDRSRDMVLIQLFTGLCFLSNLAMTLSSNRRKVFRIILATIMIFFYINIIFPDLFSFPWLMAPINQLSTYYALDYDIVGPFYISIFHILVIAIIGNIILGMEKVIERVDNEED